MSEQPTFTSLGRTPPNRSMLEDEYVPAADAFAAWVPVVANEMDLALAWTAEQVIYIGSVKAAAAEEITAIATQSISTMEGLVSAASKSSQAAASFQQAASQSAQTASEGAQIVQTAVSTLPEGTINDAMVAADKAWSSQKISEEFGNIGSLLDEINGEVA